MIVSKALLGGAVVNPVLPDEAIEFGAAAGKAFAALGGVDAARQAEDDPALRATEVAATLASLGVDDLDPRADADSLAAAAALCEAAGRVALPYPVARRAGARRRRPSRSPWCPTPTSASTTPTCSPSGASHRSTAPAASPRRSGTAWPPASARSWAMSRSTAASPMPPTTCSSTWPSRRGRSSGRSTAPSSWRSST